MIEWLVAIGLFWVISAVQFGGLLDAEGGGAGRQLLGLLLTLALYLVVVWGLRLALGSLGLGIVGRLVLPVALPLLVLGWIGRLGFRLAGVRLVSARFGAEAH